MTTYGQMSRELDHEEAAALGRYSCCEHCDHDPGLHHAGPCATCYYALPDYDRH